MGTTRCRGRIHGKAVLLDQSVSLPDNTEVDVLLTPVISVKDQAARLLAIVEAEPRLTAEDGVALMRAIEEGRRPPSPLGPFPENRRETNMPG